MPERLLTACYGLVDPILSPLNATGGSLKGLFRVEAGGRTYVFKRYRSDFRNPADVTAIHAAQAYLARRGLAVAPVIPDRTGSPICTAESGVWVLYEWVQGRHPVPDRMNPGEAAVLGETLGQLDVALADWRTDWAGAEVLQVFPVGERLELFANLLRRAEQGREPVDRLCVDSLRCRIGGLERMAHVAPQLLAMPRQWVHGDPNEGNILYAGQQERIAAVIDFDNMQRAPRGFDFVYALQACFPTAGPARDAHAGAYLSIVRPSVEEVALWVPLWAYREYCDVWPINIRYLEPAALDPAWPINVPAERWEREADRLTDWLVGLLSRG